MKALVVDDSRAIRMILRRLLQESGFEQVTEACHGRDALERLRQTGAPDLALVDWNMPEMNGLEFVSSVRHDRTFDRMTVVMVTTETETSQVQRALAAGANEYIMKPFTPEILRDKLRMLGLAA